MRLSTYTQECSIGLWNCVRANGSQLCYWLSLLKPTSHRRISKTKMIITSLYPAFKYWWLTISPDSFFSTLIVQVIYDDDYSKNGCICYRFYRYGRESDNEASHDIWSGRAKVAEVLSGWFALRQGFVQSLNPTGMLSSFQGSPVPRVERGSTICSVLNPAVLNFTVCSSSKSHGAPIRLYSASEWATGAFT